MELKQFAYRILFFMCKIAREVFARGSSFILLCIIYLRISGIFVRKIF